MACIPLPPTSKVSGEEVTDDLGGGSLISDELLHSDDFKILSVSVAFHSLLISVLVWVSFILSLLEFMELLGFVDARFA